MNEEQPDGSGGSIFQEGTGVFAGDRNWNDKLPEDYADPLERLAGQAWNLIVIHFQLRGHELINTRGRDLYNVAWIAPEAVKRAKVPQGEKGTEVTFQIPTEKIVFLDAAQIFFVNDPSLPSEEEQSPKILPEDSPSSPYDRGLGYGVRINADVDLDLARSDHPDRGDHVTLVFAPEWEGKEGVGVSAHLRQNYFLSFKDMLAAWTRGRKYRAIKPAKGYLRGPTVQQAHVLTGALTQPSRWEFDEEQALIKLPDGTAWIPFQTEEDGPKLLSSEVMQILATLGPESLKMMLSCFDYWVKYAHRSTISR